MPRNAPKIEEDITVLLSRYREGDREALGKLVPLVYDQLHRIAQIQMSKQKSGHTLTPTALVHEAFLRMQKSKDIELNDRRHFLLAASQCMKWLLVDYARAKRSEKRGGESLLRVTFDEMLHGAQEKGIDLELLSDALERLSAQDPQLGQIMELHFLIGLTNAEVASMLEISVSTVKRDLAIAKMWMRRYLDSEGNQGR